MGSGFDTALVTRERDRQRLSDMLEEKYVSERRWRNFTRLLIITVILSVCHYTWKGMVFVADNTKPTVFDTRPKESVLAQVKKQMAAGDPMLIGEGGDRTEPPRSRGARDTFTLGQIPLNLYSDLHHGGGGARPTYDPIPLGGKPWLGDLAQRRARHPRLNTGMYRPAVPGDLHKLPAHSPTRAPALYAEVVAPPFALAGDEREFPQKK